VSSSLEGVNAGGVVRFSIPKVNGFDTALVSGWEAAVLRLIRCNIFVMLVIGPEMGLGRPASAALRLSDADWREVRCDKFGTCRTNNCQRPR